MTGSSTGKSSPMSFSSKRHCIYGMNHSPVRVVAINMPYCDAWTASPLGQFVKTAFFFSMRTMLSIVFKPVLSYSVLQESTNCDTLQKWNGSFFYDTSLFELGASYQLGHDVSDTCRRPSKPVDLTLFDISGVHTVRITYCFCPDTGRSSNHRRSQLLRERWFPATWSRPGTAFTFRLLDFLHKLQTQSKMNLYDFYHSLVSVTDCAGQTPPVVLFFLSRLAYSSD